MYTDIDYRVHYSWGGIKLNQAGKLIQFTLDEPEYMIEDSKAVSKRIRDIKNILEMRYGMEFVSQIYFSQSCLEGKEIFDKVPESVKLISSQAP